MKLCARWLAYFPAAMSAQARIAVVLGAVAVAVVAFVVLQPTDTDRDDDTAGTTKTTQTGTGTGTDTETDTGATEPAPPPPPEVTRVQIRGGAVVGGAAEVEVRKGEVVRVVVASDVSDEIHLHGYDITRTAAPGRPARFRFRAELEGAFEMESHAAEDAGNDPLVVRLAVGPA